jgi:predicted porin
MKKTIVAAAIAAVVAAPAAFAEVSISGKVLGEINDGKFGTNDSTIKLSGKEDMGNGMHASFVYEGKLSFDNESGGVLTAGGKQKAAMIGNDTVTVAAGFLYGPTKGLYGFSKTAIGEDVATDNSNLLLEGTEASADAIAVMFNLGNGWKATVAAAEAADSAAAAAATSGPIAAEAVVASVAGDDGGNDDAAAGDVTWAGVDAVDNNNTLGEHKLYGITGSVGSLNIGLAYQDLLGDNNNTTTVAANTKVGDITLGAIFQDREDGANAYIVSAAATMGANTVKFAYGKSDDSSSFAGNVWDPTATDDTDTIVANDGENKAWGMHVSHAMSKQTSLYVAVKDDDEKKKKIKKKKIK